MYQQQPQYPAPVYPQYPQQPYGAPPAAYQPPAPVPQGTLSDYWGQPSSGGGPSFKFNGRPIGTGYTGVVARQITNADVRAQTDQNGRPTIYKDGRPKFVLVVPLIVQPSPEFPEGVASWWVKGQARDELVRAMAEAGAPEGPPEHGAVITVTLVGHRQIPGLNPQHQYKIEYRRPDGAPTAPVPAEQAAVQAPSAPQAPTALTPEQQQLLAKLTGSQS